jgi:GNAT superfamily N-acetyltransferase
VRALNDPSRAAGGRGLQELTVVGSSMRPTFADGDVLLVAPYAAGERPLAGEIAVFDVAGRRFAHRVVSVGEKTLVARGDAWLAEDLPVPLGDVCGRVVAVRRGRASPVPPAAPPPWAFAERAAGAALARVRPLVELAGLGRTLRALRGAARPPASCAVTGLEAAQLPALAALLARTAPALPLAELLTAEELRVALALDGRAPSAPATAAAAAPAAPATPAAPAAPVASLAPSPDARGPAPHVLGVAGARASAADGTRLTLVGPLVLPRHRGAGVGRALLRALLAALAARRGAGRTLLGTPEDLPGVRLLVGAGFVPAAGRARPGSVLLLRL